jgi:putative phosphoribosyl transferase
MSKVVEDPELRNKIKVFDNRFHAGELLSKKLEVYRKKSDVYVLAIPAGGIPVAVVVSDRLKVPLDLVITRKMHVPWNKEAGFGAISWDGLVILNKPLVSSLGLSSEEINRVASEEKEAIEHRLKLFRGEKQFPNLQEKTVILIDDGLASGFSMLTTAQVLNQKDVKEIIVAVPTGPKSAINLLKPHVDQIVCLNIRSGPFFAVADAYKEWYDIEDEDVIKLLKKD